MADEKTTDSDEKNLTTDELIERIKQNVAGSAHVGDGVLNALHGLVMTMHRRALTAAGSDDYKDAMRVESAAGALFLDTLDKYIDERIARVVDKSK